MNRIQLPIFEMRNLNVTYDNRIVLKISKFQFHRGAIYGIVGPIGSGKTTLLKVLTGKIFPTEGTVLYENEPYRKSWLGKIKPEPDITFLEAEVNNYKGTVRDYIKCNIPKDVDEIKKKYYSNARHSIEWDLNMDSLSTGMRYRTHLIVAIESDPKVLIIDDYASNFDIKLKKEFNRRILHTVKSRGTTVIISTAEPNALRDFSSVTLFLDNGHISKVRSQKS